MKEVFPEEGTFSWNLKEETRHFKVKREERQRQDRRSSGRGADPWKSRLY